MAAAHGGADSPVSHKTAQNSLVASDDSVDIHEFVEDDKSSTSMTRKTQKGESAAVGPPLAQGESAPPLAQGESAPPLAQGESAPPLAQGESAPPERRAPSAVPERSAVPSAADMLCVIDAAVEHIGLVGFNLHEYNHLITSGLNQIMTRLFSVDRTFSNTRQGIEGGKNIKNYQILINFSDVAIESPVCSVYASGQIADLFPNNSRISEIPYSGHITMKSRVEIRAYYEDSTTVDEKVVDIPTFQIGKFPTMVGGINCHTANCPREALKEMHEDPTDPGGYFIMKGTEYNVNPSENIKYNSVHIHTKMKPNEHVRAEFLSQPGGAFENSSQVRVRYMTNGEISIELASMKFKDVQLPFYLIYRMLGMSDDMAVVETVVFDIHDKNPATKHMIDILEKAFQMPNLPTHTFYGLVTEIERNKIVTKVAEHISKIRTTHHQANDNAVQFLIEELLGSATKPGGLDKILLPHMGQTSESRVRKLKFLGIIIRKILLVHLGVLLPTDRDSYKNKRVHGAGVSLAKAFKTQVNTALIISVLNALKRELNSNAWENITSKVITECFRNALVTTDLTRAMEQSITSGNRIIVVRNTANKNRVMSQMLERKNVLNTYSALRTIVSQDSGNASKTTDRAKIMRQVHPTFTGFICVSQSADSGEKVGMHKQLALTASICSAGDELPLKALLLSDPRIVALDVISSADMLTKYPSAVYVNGDLIGWCARARDIVADYRARRRNNDAVDIHTTIYWDPTTNEIEFNLDVGRLERPLLIVYNNIEEYKAARRAGNKDFEFEQNISLTKKHIRGLLSGEINFEDLIRDKIVEYITAEEQENCLLAESIDKLTKERNNVTLQYTHCDIEQAIFGLAAHMSPFGNHTQPARVTYETNQGRQTGGWYALNFPFRADKNRFFQWYNEIPLVPTITHKYIPANGVNVMLAYMSYGGDNQEDSAIINQASADRGLFSGVFFRFERVELEKGEQFCTPDPTITKNLKPNASYEKLVNGFVKVGSVINFGDVIVGRVVKLSRNKNSGEVDMFQYADHSVVYRMYEPAFVEDVLQLRGVSDENFCIVKLRYERPLRVGDKLSSRSGNKGIAAKMMPHSDMPFTESGITPDIIVNPHCIPTRMTVGQLIEGSVSKICSRRGVVHDGTSFLPINHYEIADELYEMGFRYNGCERMYNGMTGTYVDAAIFIAKTTMQRLQKFVIDDCQVSSSSGPTDPMTGQPLGGKHIEGGLRLGEMENWCIHSHGAELGWFEKMSIDSDGREAFICRGCGGPAIYNEYLSIYKCRACGNLADISVIDSCKGANLFREEVAASNVKMTIGLQPREFDVYAAE